MDSRAENINWNCPAGKQLDRLAGLLPKPPRLDITVFGSAPLQLFLNPDFLSQDVDLFAPEEHWDYLTDNRFRWGIFNFRIRSCVFQVSSF